MIKMILLAEANDSIRKKCIYSVMTHNIGTSMHPSQQQHFAGSRLPDYSKASTTVSI
jgi:hypothetical protein